MRRQSHIERHARQGQTSEQLAERNSLRRLVFYAVLGGVAGGLLTGLVFPTWLWVGTILGGVLGLGLAIAIDEKLKRVDQMRRSEHASDMAQERERALQAKIRAARENGEFERWDEKP
ncbi:hypothetical protein XM53_01075 [Roseovarius atlanticus]|uniref:Uncharacterized protein n=1 Tax=Roseovarius atlanticus TaxID=1641875 RepID=A0A0T5NZQ4_9RHOB|nr:hypothetical protein [Roseovarius atlanticus]KRS14354.1 hypothetical protein XM53_01075 [Roseovarius atlanticus]